MKLDLTNDEAVDVIEMIADVYSDLLLQHQMIRSGGNKQPVDSLETLEEMLFKSANVLTKLNRQVHDAGICNCTDDRNMELQERIFAETFKERIELNQWWQEQVLSRGSSLAEVPQSPTSDQPSAKDVTKLLQGQGKPPESFEGPENKLPQKH